MDWTGSGTTWNEKRFEQVGSIEMEGRQGRAYLVNHARRITDKIVQYVFASPPERSGVPESMEIDITRDGVSLNNFLADTLRMLVACKWCWIGVDSPKTGISISIADAKANAIRPYWVLYDPTQVVDWRRKPTGELEWIITEGEKWDNQDPFAPPVSKHIRRLWQPGEMQEWEIKLTSGGMFESATMIDRTRLDFNEIPFVPVGEVSQHPHWFDDVEDVQRAIMDLESCLDTLFHKVVFAQPVLPSSVAEGMAGEVQGQDVAKRVGVFFGYANAILESSEERGITRYIGPDGSAIAKIQDELTRKREIMFDTVGLHLGFQKTFSESPEVKAFDQLDPQAVLRNYSQQIAEAERRAWRLTRAIDPSVAEVTVTYANKFHVSDLFEDFKSLILVNQVDAPDSLRRLVLNGVTDSLLEIMRSTIDPEVIAKIRRDINTFEFNEPINLDASSIAARSIAGTQNQGTDSGEGLPGDTGQP
ncbi:MAG: hypothetical protein OEQ18_00150 [Gammaproteobacteria bacterium]|nr:hypothetical protein [Gammaproteobacteria bacterium]